MTSYCKTIYIKTNKKKHVKVKNRLCPCFFMSEKGKCKKVKCLQKA